MHLASLCLLVGAFNPFTFKVIIDMYVPMTIFLIVFGLFLQVFSSLVFPTQRSSFSICCRAGLMVLNSLSFCLSVKLLTSPSNLNEILGGQSNLGCRFFPFISLSISCHSLLFFLIIYLFIYGCVGSSFLSEGFLQPWQVGATLHRSARAFHCRGLPCCRAQAPDAQAQQLWRTGLVAPRHVGSSQTRAQTHVSCINRQTLNHCATREARHSLLVEFLLRNQLLTLWEFPCMLFVIFPLLLLIIFLCL